MTDGNSITVRELSDSIAAGEKWLLLDVREPHELVIATLPAVVPIPLGELADRVGELDPGTAIVVLCHHGVRSAHAASFLRTSGFETVLNLTGGIDAWSREVDPAIPRY